MALYDAKYLSMTGWYGHREELTQIAAKMHIVLDNIADLYRESRAIAFDLPHFSIRVRVGLQARHAPGASRPPATLVASAAEAT